MDSDEQPSDGLCEFAGLLDWISRCIGTSIDHDLGSWLDHVAATAPPLLGLRSMSVEVRHPSGLTDLHVGLATTPHVDQPTRTVRVALPAPWTSLLAEVVGATSDAFVESCLRVISHSTPTDELSRTHGLSDVRSPPIGDGAVRSPLQRIQLLEEQYSQMRNLLAFTASLTAQQLDGQKAIQTS